MVVERHSYDEVLRRGPSTEDLFALWAWNAVLTAIVSYVEHSLRFMHRLARSRLPFRQHFAHQLH